MKKRILGVLMYVTLLTLLLVGCGAKDKDVWNESSGSTEVAQDTESNQSSENTTSKQTDDNVTKKLGLELVADNDDGFTYYRDRVTDGLFVCRTKTESRNGYGVGLSLTPIPDPETGKQITYTKYLELYEELNAQ